MHVKIVLCNFKRIAQNLLKFQLDGLIVFLCERLSDLCLARCNYSLPAFESLHIKAHPHVISLADPFLHPSPHPLMPHSSLRTLGSAPSSWPSTAVTLSSAGKLVWLKANAVAVKGGSALFFGLASTHLDGPIRIMDTVQHNASNASNNHIV